MTAPEVVAPSEFAEPNEGASDTDPPERQAPAPASSPMNRRRVLAMAIPIIGENFLQTLVGAADTIMVTRLGKESVAGVGTALEFIFFILAALSAISIGATVLVSQATGAGDHSLVNRYARQAIVWGVIMAIPVGIAGYFLARPAIGLFGAEEEVTQHGATYLQITAATSVVLLLSFVCGAIFRGVGDSRTPLLAASVANVVNIAATWVLIFGQFGMPELGVAGSAWGSAIGRAVGAAILLTLLVRGRNTLSLRGRLGWRPEPGTAKRLMRLGVPAALEQMLMSGGFVCMIAVVAILGTAELAAQQIGFTALSMAFLPGFGFAIAATALVGQSVGAKNLADARDAARIAMNWSIAWMTVGGLIYFVLARPVMDAFSDDPEVIDAGVDALRALSIGLPFWAIWAVNGGALRGSGDTRTPMVSSTIAVWLAVVLAWVAVVILDLGLGAVWLTFFISAPIAAFYNLRVLRRRLAPNSTLLAEIAIGEAAPVVMTGAQ